MTQSLSRLGTDHLSQCGALRHPGGQGMSQTANTRSRPLYPKTGTKLSRLQSEPLILLDASRLEKQSEPMKGQPTLLAKRFVFAASIVAQRNDRAVQSPTLSS